MTEQPAPWYGKRRRSQAEAPGVPVVIARRPRYVELAAALTVILLPLVGRAETLSVPELTAKVRQWEAGRKIPPPVQYQVEGRGTLLNRRRLQFRNCRIPFEALQDLPEPTRRNPNLEVTGTVVRDEQTGAYFFRVQSMRELPGDLETFLDRRRLLRDQPAEAWYDLGDWAAKRAEFYNDQELLARSEEAYLRGVELERQGLVRGDPAGLFALAEKARGFQLPDRLVEELRHEALVDLWSGSRDATGDKLAGLLKQIGDLLPRSTIPLSDPQLELQKTYFESPIEVYHNADARTRQKLHRLLYVDVLLRTITAEYATDGSNGFAIAEKIDSQVPEQHALAENYRDRALAARSREVESLSKPELLALSEEYRSRKQPQRADHLIETWLTLHQRRLEPDDTEGLIQLTDDYRSLLKRHDLADRLLKEAWKRNPRAADIAERLQRAGYQLHEGAWLSATEYHQRPESHLEQAIRAGRVEIGMTSGNLRRSLGDPQRVARSATSGLVTEIWTYDQTGSARLTVRLERNRRQSETTVVEVTQSTGN